MIDFTMPMIVKGIDEKLVFNNTSTTVDLEHHGNMPAYLTIKMPGLQPEIVKGMRLDVSVRQPGFKNKSNQQIAEMIHTAISSDAGNSVAAILKILNDNWRR